MSAENSITHEVALAQKSEADLKDISNLNQLWQTEFKAGRSQLYKPDGSINHYALENFRRYNILLHEMGPETDFANWNPKYWYKLFFSNPFKSTKQFLRQRINGQLRGNKMTMLKMFDTLETLGVDKILRKHDASQTPGNPFVYLHKGCVFNTRWLRYAYFVFLAQKYLKQDINESPRRFVSLDLGCNFGGFSYFFKSEFPKTTQILVDLPDQIVLADYFLRNKFKDAKIATYLDIRKLEKIDRQFVEKFDFVLIPITQYDKLMPDVADMYTNFDSLGEMMRPWFEYYMKSAAFKGVKIFMTTNRFVSSPAHEPTHGNDLTIWDYKLDQFNHILFDVNPILTLYSKIHHKYFYSIESFSSQFFDFIGKK